MKTYEPSFFFDTADLDYITKAWDKLSPLFSATAIRGITTNPSALNKMQISDLEKLKSQLEKLCKWNSKIRPDGKAIVYVQQPNSNMDAESVYRWVNILKNLGDGKTKIGLKIPPFPSILEASKSWSKDIEINVTGVADASTALRAFSYGVRYVSIIVGRMEEIGVDARKQVQFVQQRAKDSAEIITGSMRTLEGLKWVCEEGTVPTIGTRVFDKIFTEMDMKELPKFWTKPLNAQELKLSPTVEEKQIDLSKAFFSQMDELGSDLHKAFRAL